MKNSFLAPELNSIKTAIWVNMFSLSLLTMEYNKLDSFPEKLDRDKHSSLFNLNS
jgi:hypothetical protein